jgi:hypothetical protein
MTLADERQVVQDLEGNALQSMVYGFRAGGKMVYGLSWIGAREAVRNFNARTSSQIRVSDATPPQFEDVTIKAEVGRGEDGPLMEEVPAIRCTVYAEDAALGGGQWGTATVAREQINKKKLKDGRYLTNPDGFAAAKALSKAQRNALEPLIPRWLIEELIAQFKGNGQVEYLEGTGKQVVKELPPALTDDRAKAQTDRCRELYAEWSKHGGKKTMPPAQFNNAMTACQHSHERLDDFIAHLESKLNEARGE